MRVTPSPSWTRSTADPRVVDGPRAETGVGPFRGRGGEGVVPVPGQVSEDSSLGRSPAWSWLIKVGTE